MFDAIFSFMPTWAWIVTGVGCVVYAAFSIADAIRSRRLKKAGVTNGRDNDTNTGNHN